MPCGAMYIPFSDYTIAKGVDTERTLVETSAVSGATTFSQW